MALSLVLGSPFSGKGAWISSQIEEAEEAGEVGHVSLNFTALYAGLVPGVASVYRDDRIHDSGAARYAGYLAGVAIEQAVRRELDGYVAIDSPRRAVALLETLGTNRVTEVRVTEAEALRRSAQHVELVRDLVDRAEGDETEARCRQMVRDYYRERPILDGVEVREVTAPERPSDQAIQYMWSAAIKAARRGDEAKRQRWIDAAKRALAVRGVTA